MNENIEKFGGFLGKRVEKHPRAVARALSGAYRAIGFQAGHFPNKALNASREFGQGYTARVLAEMLDHPEKTAVVNIVHNARQKGEEIDRSGLAASFAAAVSDTLVPRTMAAARELGYDNVVVAGGVAANVRIRADFEAACRAEGRTLYVPPLSLCGDNAAMIGCQGYYEYLAGHVSGVRQDAYATMDISADFPEFDSLLISDRGGQWRKKQSGRRISSPLFCLRMHVIQANSLYIHFPYAPGQTTLPFLVKSAVFPQTCQFYVNSCTLLFFHRFASFLYNNM